MTSHVQNKSPDFILLAHFDDDTHVVVCHYHIPLPYELEVTEMCKEYFHSLCPAHKEGLLRFQLAEVLGDMPRDAILSLGKESH